MSEAPPPHHHRSARERQRRGPMWGCLKALVWTFGISLALLLLIVGGGWWYLGTGSFAGLVQLRVAKTLEARLGRHVSIGKVEIVRARPARVIITDLRVDNSPGAIHPYFATVKQLVITGGIDSFWGRKINVQRVDIREPHLFFEVYPAGSKLAHNFPHWNSGPPSKYEIYHLDIGSLFITGGAFDFLDRKHDIAAVTTGLTSQINVTRAEDLYAGTASSPRLTVRIQNYKPFDLDLRGGFRFTPDNLALQSVAMRGRDMQVFVSGSVHPLSEAVYDLRLTSQLGLDRVREIFAINKVLDGALSIDGSLRGHAGNFALTGGWVSPKISADVYDLANARGKLNITDTRAVVDVDTARYGGGTIGAHYVLPGYAEPYPMSVDLRYNGVSLEKLFNDWGIKDSGLRGAATGRLAYHWNKDRVLAGGGEGNASLARATMAFSNAKYPVPLGGSANFALDNGVIRFSRASLTTEASTIDFSGSLRIADVNTDLALRIHSGDLGELDRIGYNFAHSAGKKTYTLLGLGGAGDVTGTLRGRLKSPTVIAHIAASGAKYNNVLLGEAGIDLRYDGDKSLLTFQHATFREANGTLAMTGTIAFPERGPSPVFDLAIDAQNYPAERATQIVTLPLKGIHGNATGRMLISGSPEQGKVTFANLLVSRGTSEVRLKGTVNWLPGKGTSRFDLDLAARNFPITDVAEFLDLGKLPVTGELTGTLHLEGTKTSLEGAGAVTVRKGVLFGEPVDVATAEVQFTQGRVKAQNVHITAPGGSITAEGELNLTTNQFSYNIKSSSIDLSKLQIFKSLAGLLGGNLTITSTGAGTFENPEVVAEATLTRGTLKGLALPAGSPPPTIYIAIRGGRLVIRGNIAGLLTIEGDGTVGKDLAVDGLVHITVPDIARLAAVSPATATLPASGNFTLDLKLGGKLNPVDALVVDGTFSAFRLKLSDHEFVAARPLRVGLRAGRIHFDDFELTHPGASLVVSGFAAITGNKAVDVAIRGSMEAALLQLFVKDLRADGHINLAATVTGTLDNPRLGGSAEVQEATFRVPGFAQVIDRVTGTLVFRGDRIDIDSLRATIGGGQVVAGGFIAVSGVKPVSARVTLQGTDVAIRYFEGLTIDGNFNLLLSGGVDRMVLAGDIAVNRAVYSKDFDFATAFLNAVLSRRSLTPIAAATWQDRVSMRLHIAAPGTLAVRNNIADLTGSADLDVSGTLANPVILGVVNLDEGGRVTLQKINYALTRGSITFQNPFRIDPYFDLTLEGRISGGGFTSELESGPVDVTINLTGTIDRFTPSITSDPPASDITLFSLLGFGALVNQNTAGKPSGGGFGTVGASLLTQSLGLLTNKIFPFVDTFTYEPETLDTTSDRGQKVSFEKRVSNNVRVLVVYNLTQSKSRVLLEWQVNPDWTLQFTNDEIRREFRAEARFRRRYAGQWRWGGNHQPVTLTASAGPLEGPIIDLDKQEPPAPVPPTGPPVARITYRADANFDTAVLGRYISVRPGGPLALRDVQQSIKSLYATGNFRDIRVETTPEANGAVEVTFALSINYRVTAIQWDGLGGADRERADRDLSVHTGDVLSLNAVDRSATAVQQFLNRSGYLEAAVDPETTFNRTASGATVIFHVAEGPLAHVGSVVLDGNTDPFQKAELIAQMKRGPGKPFRVADARLDAERIARFMWNRDYRKADVRYASEKYDTATKTVTLRYTATSGPKVRVEVEGVPRHDVRRVLPFAKNQGYSEDVIDSTADNIVKLYQQRGYFNATADPESKLADNVWTTTFHVNPGPHFKLEKVTFSGNRQIPEKELAGIAQTSPGGGFRSLIGTLLRRPSGVTSAQLSADRDALESYYRLHGFSEAQVAAAVVTTNAATGTMAVDFPITEGPQTIVRNVRIEGNEQVATGELPHPTLKTGEPLDPQSLRADLLSIESFYAARGNAEVQVTPRPDVSADKTAATITYVISEGPKIKVGEVVVRGNTYTQSDLITRKAGLESGEPFSYTKILEAQRDLYRVGAFQRVDIQAEQAGTSVADRNVVIQVEEGKDLSVAGSLGVTKTSAAGFAPLGSASIAHRNLLGTGRYLGAEVVLAPGERKEAFLTYREPFVGRFNVPVTFTIFNSDEHRPSARVQQRGASVELTKVAGLQTRWSLRYEYRIGKCVDGTLCTQAQEHLLPGVAKSITDIDISSITPTFFWDRRDDPIDPHRGFFTTALVEYAFPIFSASANFAKEYAQASYYLPVSARSVFAVSSRVGFIQPLGFANDPITDERGRPIVPFTERFTGGGESSHRAYSLDLLGDLCTPTVTSCVGGTLLPLFDENGKRTGIAPLGGNGLFITNLEYRFPVFSTVGGAVFTDIGNVYATQAIHLNDLRYGVGAGVRYLSPVGPLRFDIGYKLRRREYEKPFAYFITLGYAF